MKQFILPLTAALALAVFCATDAQVSTGLQYLGTLNGVSYFAEYTRKDWTAAKSLCALAGLRLASIDRKDKQVFLTGNTNGTLTTNNYYWTDGREARNSSHFVSDSSGLPLDAGLQWMGSPFPTMQCVAFYYSKSSASHGRLQFVSCGASQPVICQSLVSCKL